MNKSHNPIGYVSQTELERLQSGHNASLRSARFGPSSLDGDVAVYLADNAPFVPGSSKELNAIHAVIMSIGDPHPDVEGDTYTLHHVKRMARELSATNKAISRLRESVRVTLLAGVPNFREGFDASLLALLGCKHFSDLQ